MRHAHQTFSRVIALLFLSLTLAACSTLSQTSSSTDSAPAGNFDASKIPDATPQKLAKSKYGNPKSYVVAGKRYHVLATTKGYSKVGHASWYGTKFHGRLTSSREPYNMYAMTAASPTLPIPSYVRVTNLKNNRSVVVKVNDRGPFKSDRIIDLSYAAAKKLGYTGIGTAKVHVAAIDTDKPISDQILLAENKIKSEPRPQGSVAGVKNTTSDPRQSKNTALLAESKTSISIAKVSDTQLASNQPSKPVYIQVGAFQKRSSAESLSKRITQLAADLKGIPVSVKEGNSNAKKVYRVHIGPLKDSEKVAQLLAENGFDKPTIVRG